MRDGELVGTVATVDVTAAEIANMMVGRQLDLRRYVAASPAGEACLRVRDLAVRGRSGMAALRRIDFDVHAGEIVGVAGVAQNGQEALVAALAGFVTPERGEVRLADTDLTHVGMAQRRAAGMALVPADRHGTGLALDASVIDNVCAGTHQQTPLAQRGWLNLPAMEDRAQALVVRFEIRGAPLSAPARGLSGGNQQKLVLGRELSQGAKVLVIDQPTWGVDVGAIEYIYKELDAARAAGAAILLISSDLNEIMQLSDRVLVLHAGELAGTVTGDVVTDEYHLGQLMAGLTMMA